MITLHAVKTLTKPEIDQIVALYQDAGWWDAASDRSELLPKVAAGSLFFIVLKNEAEKIVGMGRVISDGFSDAYIQDIVVLKDYRGQGLGKKIVADLRDRCKKAEIMWIGLVAEPGTEPFYNGLGFKSKPGYQLMTLS